MSVLASLTNRIFLASALLVVLTIGFTAAFVSTKVTTEAEAELQRGLAEATTAVDGHNSSLSETFSLLARLIADLPKLKAAVATGDPPTVRGTASDYNDLLRRADLVAVTDRRGRVLAAVGTAMEVPGVASDLPPAGDVLRGSERTSYRAHPLGILEIVTVPITVGRAPLDIAGTLSVGFLLDDRRAMEFKALTGSEVAFALEGRVRAATISGEYRQTLGAALSTGRLIHLPVGDDDFVAMARTLAAANGSTTGTRPVVIVLRSRTERLRFLSAIHTVIGGTVVIGVLLATILSYVVARSITSPLGAITAVMREVAATGDLTRKIRAQTGPWQDEDARLLATTFNTLTDSIVRFEQEGAHRERLSLLGRLSSVVAHEIRNPLMIIKASVRALGRPDATPQAIIEATADIDGEVVRLNRLVSEVLDFARPVQFDIQPTDINAVCRDSAAAASVDGFEPAIDLVLHERLPQILTDAERIRTVLVNLLTNAQHAVRDRADDEATGDRTACVALAAPDSVGSHQAAPIQIQTTPSPSGGVTIIVRDAGSGITPEVLPRLFEPYVTTRRTGTGLGLAIAKNIVDGLGGTIDVTSLSGRGTTFSMTLPAAPPRAPVSGSPRAADERSAS
ncbi:MAG: ATP-binding protein [Acidobacteriota bacterium]